jgi:hypothetical protein
LEGSLRLITARRDVSPKPKTKAAESGGFLNF